MEPGTGFIELDDPREDDELSIDELDPYVLVRLRHNPTDWREGYLAAKEENKDDPKSFMDVETYRQIEQMNVLTVKEPVPEGSYTETELNFNERYFYEDQRRYKTPSQVADELVGALGSPIRYASSDAKQRAIRDYVEFVAKTDMYDTRERRNVDEGEYNSAPAVFDALNNFVRTFYGKPSYNANYHMDDPQLFVYAYVERDNANAIQRVVGLLLGFNARLFLTGKEDDNGEVLVARNEVEGEWIRYLMVYAARNGRVDGSDPPQIRRRVLQKLGLYDETRFFGQAAQWTRLYWRGIKLEEKKDRQALNGTANLSYYELDVDNITPSEITKADLEFDRLLGLMERGDDYDEWQRIQADHTLQLLRGWRFLQTIPPRRIDYGKNRVRIDAGNVLAWRGGPIPGLNGLPKSLQRLITRQGFEVLPFNLRPGLIIPRLEWYAATAIYEPWQPLSEERIYYANHDPVTFAYGRYEVDANNSRVLANINCFNDEEMLQQTTMLYVVVDPNGAPLVTAIVIDALPIRRYGMTQEDDEDSVLFDDDDDDDSKGKEEDAMSSPDRKRTKKRDDAGDDEGLTNPAMIFDIVFTIQAEGTVIVPKVEQSSGKRENVERKRILRVKHGYVASLSIDWDAPDELLREAMTELRRLVLSDTYANTINVTYANPPLDRTVASLCLWDEAETLVQLDDSFQLRVWEAISGETEVIELLDEERPAKRRARETLPQLAIVSADDNDDDDDDDELFNVLEASDDMEMGPVYRKGRFKRMMTNLARLHAIEAVNDDIIWSLLEDLLDAGREFETRDALIREMNLWLEVIRDRKKSVSINEIFSAFQITP